MPAADRGLAQVNRVLDRRPRSAEALVVRASLTLVRAQRARDAAERRALAERAHHDFEAALTANHMLDKVWAGEAALAQTLAR